MNCQIKLLFPGKLVLIFLHDKLRDFFHTAVCILIFISDYLQQTIALILLGPPFDQTLGKKFQMCDRPVIIPVSYTHLDVYKRQIKK